MILICVILFGYLVLNIMWYKDDKKLSLFVLWFVDDCRINGFYYIEKYWLFFVKYLVICKLSYIENIGVYKCEVKNSKGNSFSEVFLNVLG